METEQEVLEVWGPALPAKEFYRFTVTEYGRPVTVYLSKRVDILVITPIDVWNDDTELNGTLISYSLYGDRKIDLVLKAPIEEVMEVIHET